jgi:hypothetical protein
VGLDCISLRLARLRSFSRSGKSTTPAVVQEHPRESKKIHYQSLNNKRPAFRSKSVLRSMWTSFNLVNDTSASRNVMHFSLMFGQPPETVRV